MVEVRFKGSKGDKGRKGAVMVNTKTERGGEGERGAVGLLLELFWLYGNGNVTEEAPLMTCGGKGDWEDSSRGRAPQCLRDGIASVGEKREEEGRGTGSRIYPEEFSWNSGTVGGATRLTAIGVPEDAIKTEERWSSDLFMLCVRANMEDPVCVSEVLEHGTRDFEIQPGQGTRCGGMGKVSSTR